MKMSMKNPIFQRILRKYFPFFLMVLFVESGILSPQKAFCEDEDVLQTERANHIQVMESMQSDVHYGYLPAIVQYLISFSLYNSHSSANCLAKAYADKAIDVIQHKGAVTDPSLTREGFKDWGASIIYIFYFEAYFMHEHICGAVPDLKKEREFLKISCHLERDYQEDKEGAAHICRVLKNLTSASSPFPFLGP